MMKKKKKYVKEEGFLKLVTIVENFVQNYVEVEHESYLPPN